MLLWASPPSSLKRCLGRGLGLGARVGLGQHLYPDLCSFRTALSQTWRLWFAPAMGRMGPCRCCRCVGQGGVGACWQDLSGLTPPLPIFIPEEHPAPGSDNL